MSERYDYAYFPPMRISYSVFLLSRDKKYKLIALQYVTCTYLFSRQFRPPGRPVTFILAIFSLIFFSFTASLWFFIFSRFYFWISYFMVECMWFLLPGSTLRFHWPLGCRSLSGASHVDPHHVLPFAWPRTNQKYDWDTWLVTKTKNKNIEKPENHG